MSSSSSSSSCSPSLLSTYRRVVVKEAKGDFVLEDVPMPKLGPKDVLVKVEACGLCHSDSYGRNGFWPGMSFPRVLGHEVAGTVAAVGSDVKSLSVGQRVGQGWTGGHCGQCDYCRRGEVLFCSEHQITGFNLDGGYQEYMLTKAESLAKLPENIPFEQLGPLLCAGVTVFNSLRNMKVMAPALVAVQGIGGLGHLAIQFAVKLGYQVVAISSGEDKRSLALNELGAHYYLNSTQVNVVDECKKLGGINVLLATAFSSEAVQSLLPAMGRDGIVLQLGADQTPVQVQTGMFIGQRLRYQGWPSGQALDSQDCCKFASYTGVKTIVETYRLDQAKEAYERMMSNQARFRVVIMPFKQ